MADKFFDKYELYSEGDSAYSYPGTGILKNKLNIQNAEKFKEAEAEIAFAGLLELELNPIKGRFDRAHLYAIHQFLFEPFYDFAGKTRTEDISKGNTKFCVWSYIEKQLDELFLKIKYEDKSLTDREKIVDFLSYVMAELNTIHPFREGNGRTIREFIREYALHFGYEVDWKRKSKIELMDAMIESVFDRKHLNECLNRCIKEKS